jgi:hypothetical protein
MPHQMGLVAYTAEILAYLFLSAVHPSERLLRSKLNAILDPENPGALLGSATEV